MQSKRIHVLGSVLGVLLMLYGAASSARAHAGDLCFGYIHQVKLSSGVWVFFRIDCTTYPCPVGTDPCMLVPVEFDPYKYRCGCDGAEDGTCDATQVNGAGGTTGQCSGSCSPGSCHQDGSSIEWTDQYGIKHRKLGCGC
jgi:hypothetical protein